MGAVQQYIDLYRSQKNLINSHSSAVMNGLREEAVALLESRGLPSLKDEEPADRYRVGLFSRLRVESGSDRYRDQSL